MCGIKRKTMTIKNIEDMRSPKVGDVCHILNKKLVIVEINDDAISLRPINDPKD